MYYNKELVEARVFRPVFKLINTTLEIDERSEQRAIGDIIEHVVRNSYIHYVDKNIEFIDRSSPRSIEDFTVVYDDFNIHERFLVDIKTHNFNKDFSMPNLTSFRRLVDVYNEPNSNLFYLFVEYTTINRNKLLYIKDIKVCAPHHIPIDCLRFGNLGHGQLQVKNMKKFRIDRSVDKNYWLETMYKKIIDFNLKLAESAIDRVDYWEKISKPEVLNYGICN